MNPIAAEAVPFLKTLIKVSVPAAKLRFKTFELAEFNVPPLRGR